MGLLQDGYSFEGCEHGIVQHGPLDTPLIFGAFNGVSGVSIIADEPKSQPIMCRAVLEDYADFDDLEAAIDALLYQQGRLTGTLTVSGALTREFPKCTFASFDVERVFRDGSGVHDWCCFGRLVWIRRSRD